MNNIPVAYAVTYLVGTTAVIWFLSSLAPRLLRIDLRRASSELEVALMGKAESSADVRSAYQAWDIRALRVENPGWAGRTVAQIERPSRERASSSSACGRARSGSSPARRRWSRAASASSSSPALSAATMSAPSVGDLVRRRSGWSLLQLGMISFIRFGVGLGLVNRSVRMLRR